MDMHTWASLQYMVAVKLQTAVLVKLLRQAIRNIQFAVHFSTVTIEFDHVHLPVWQCDFCAFSISNLSGVKFMWVVPAERMSSSTWAHNLLCVCSS